MSITEPEPIPGRPVAISRPAVAAVESYEDPVHDHREFDAEPIPASEYSAGGGDSILSPHTSVPGRARPGMASPGAV
jgi:hypothetical protein